MPTARAASGLLVAVLLVAGQSGCSSGRSSTVGRVSDLTGRLCLRTTSDNGTCFGVEPALLASVRLGQCVRVEYTGGGSGREPAATAVRPADAGCPGSG